MTAMVKNFLSRDIDGMDFLIIQADPIACGISLINHARHIAVQQNALADDLHTRGQKVVLFIVHLPPGIRERRRWFGLDFRPPFQTYFVDDLRCQLNGEETDLTFLVRNSPFVLVKEGIVNVRRIVLSK